MLSEEEKQERMLANIRENINAIQAILRNCSTESVAQRCMLEKGYMSPDFTSPAKQISFLLGLLLATEEPSTPRAFSDGDWEEVARLLEKLFDVYAERYTPDGNQVRDQPAQLVMHKLIPVLAFLDYFYKIPLTNPRELHERIVDYVVPFDGRLAENWGITASDCLTIVYRIVQDIQSRWNDSITDADVIQSAEMLAPFRKISRGDLVAKHGIRGTIFWEMFTIGRGEGNPLQYPTDQSVVERRPLIRVSDDVALFCDLKEIFLSVLTQCEKYLSQGINNKRYLTHRAETTEAQTARLFRRILGDTARIYRNLYETPDNHYEHDIIVIHDDICLFVEVKSSPPREPRRNPEKGLTQLRRSFRSSTGIQNAYNQTLRLLNSVRHNETTTLYDKQGNETLRLPKTIQDNIFCICVTRDSFGPLRGLLSLLLDKEEDDPYPWVASTLELESMAEAWEYYRWNARQLKAFLAFRLGLQPFLLGDDELDFIGAYILNCGLYQFNSTDGLLTPIDPTYAYIFDVIHNQLLRDVAPQRFYPVIPIDSSSREFLQTGESVLSRSSRQQRIPVGNNEPCPCQSGVDFIRCHGLL